MNWSTNGQTLTNLAIVAIGDETHIEVHAGGAGSTHFIVDLQGYIPRTGVNEWAPRRFRPTSQVGIRVRFLEAGCHVLRFAQ